MTTDAELLSVAKAEIRDGVSFAVIELIQSMARARGSFEQPQIPAEDAAAAFRELAVQLEQQSQEMAALAALAVPGWTVALTAVELNLARSMQRAEAANRPAS